MIDALGRPQSLLLLGGTSEIALAVARAWSDALPVVTLAARPGVRRDEAAAGLRAAGFEVEVCDFEAEATDTHPALIEGIAARRDIDVALVAFGVLGDEEEAWTDHAAAVHLAQVNYTAAVSVGVCLARRDPAPGPRHHRRPVVGGGGARAPLELRLRLLEGRAWTASSSGSARRCASTAGRCSWSGQASSTPG